MSNKMYAPVCGRQPTREDIVHAATEFRRLLEDTSKSEEERERGLDVRVVLATDVDLHEWLKSFTDTSGVTIDAILKPDTSLKDPTATADLVISKLTDRPEHAAVMVQVDHQLATFAGANGNLVTVGNGGRLDLDGEIRYPDAALRPRNGHFKHLVGRVLVEVELENRSVTALHDWCQTYFQHPLVRQVIALKFFPVRQQSSDHAFAALALQYERLAPAFDEDESCVRRAISFGSAELLESVKSEMPEPILQCLDVLPHLTFEEALGKHNPWVHLQQHPRPFLTVPHEDYMYEGGGNMSSVHDLLAVAVAGSDPFELDLFRVLHAYVSCVSSTGGQITD